MVNRKAPADPRSSMWDLMGYYLRFLRQERGATARELSAIIGAAESTTSRIESGKQKMSEAHAERVDKAWKTGNIFSLLLYYARRASDPNWFKTVTYHEEIATELRIFAALHVPGLVQIEEYARALLTAGRDPNVERSLADRMGRQGVLTKRQPPELWLTVMENVLDWPVGGAGVMYQQLARLLELAEQPNVIFRVLTRDSGASEALDGPFRLVNTPDGDVAFCDAAVEGRLVSDADDVNGFRNRFDRICSEALPVSQSLALVREKMETLYGTALA